MIQELMLDRVLIIYPHPSPSANHLHMNVHKSTQENNDEWNNVPKNLRVLTDVFEVGIIPIGIIVFSEEDTF